MLLSRYARVSGTSKAFHTIRCSCHCMCTPVPDDFGLSPTDNGTSAAPTQGVYVPEMYHELTRPRVLIMEWVEGRRLRSAGGKGPATVGLGRAEDLRLVEIGVLCSLEQVPWGPSPFTCMQTVVLAHSPEQIGVLHGAFLLACFATAVDNAAAWGSYVHGSVGVQLEVCRLQSPPASAPHLLVASTASSLNSLCRYCRQHSFRHISRISFDSSLQAVCGQQAGQVRTASRF